MRIAFLSLSAAFAVGPALAQAPGVHAPEAVAAAPQQPSERPLEGDPQVNQVIVYGDDPCPPSTEDVITVCARLPEDDRYRIPPGLRDDPNDPVNRSWTNRAVELSYVGRTGAESCSTVGGGGFTGCFNQIVQQARAERAAAGDINWTRMIEEAREERRRRIAEAEAEEAERERNQPD